MNNFTLRDWDGLKNSINVSHDNWCCACAETLSDAIDFQHAIPVLLVLVKHKNRNVKIIALDSLRSQISRFDSIKDSLKDEIQDVLKNHIPEGEIERVLIDDMKKKISEFT